MAEPREPRGITFSNHLAAAIRAGIKTQTRRLTISGGTYRASQRSEWTRALPGERLYVREQWVRLHESLGGGIIYGSDPLHDGLQGDHPRNWKPARYMPRSAARTFLTITDVRTERLQDITEADCFSEGIQRATRPSQFPFGVPGIPGTWDDSPRESFAALWDHIHDKHDWRSNPDVIVLTFRQETPPQ